MKFPLNLNHDENPLIKQDPAHARQLILLFSHHKYNNQQDDDDGNQDPYQRSSNSCTCKIHDDVIKWKQFLRYWPFVRGIHRSPVDSPHKGQ